MKLYKRGKVWYYRFQFAGQRIHESSRTDDRPLAQEIMYGRLRELQEAFGQVKKRQLPPPLPVAAQAWVDGKIAISRHTEVSYRGAIGRLGDYFGRTLLCDITADSVAAYQKFRKGQGVGPRTMNIEVGVLRGILKKAKLWQEIADEISFLPENPSPGRAITEEEESRLLKACAESRNRGLYGVVMLALNTGMRSVEIRRLTWSQVDFLGHTLTVGKTKTRAGTGRPIPLNDRAFELLKHWRSQFADLQPEHFVFPGEKYGFSGVSRLPCAYYLDPTRPMNSWKVAWRGALKRAGFQCRFHDLRHTFISRLAESQASDSTIMALAGHVSREMMERYSHIRTEAKRKAVDSLPGQDFSEEVAQKWSHFPVRNEQENHKSLKRSGEPPGTRTQNPLIKSQMLYQLS